MSINPSEEREPIETNQGESRTYQDKLEWGNDKTTHNWSRSRMVSAAGSATIKVLHREDQSGLFGHLWQSNLESLSTITVYQMLCQD